MNYFGFYKPSKEVGLRPSQFVIENTMGLAGLFGLKPDQICVQRLMLATESEAMVGTPQSPLTVAGDLFCPEKEMVILYNHQAVGKLVPEGTPVRVGIIQLWAMVTRAIRRWVVLDNKVAAEELLSPSFLTQFGGGEKVIKEIALAYEKKNWDSVRACIESDMIFASICVAGYVEHKISNRLDLNENYIAKVIFEMRKGNWEDIVWKLD